MMKQIDRQYIISILIFIISLNISSCVSNHINTLSNSNLNEQRSDSIKIKIKKMRLAREIYSWNNFTNCDQCGNEFIIPLLVKLNKDDFIKSYDTVYSYDSEHIEDILMKKGIKFSRVYDLDPLFRDRIYAYNTIKLYTSKKYKKKINRIMKKNHQNNKFDGYFSYALYELEFKCVYGGVRPILLPNIEGKTLYIKKMTKVYYITEILSIKPIIPKFPPKSFAWKQQKKKEKQLK